MVTLARKSISLLQNVGFATLIAQSETVSEGSRKESIPASCAVKADLVCFLHPGSRGSNQRIFDLRKQSRL